MLLYDAVIFDLDGTLTDSQPGIFACAKYALEKMGLPVPPEAVLRRFLGPPLAESYIKYCDMTEEQAAYATDLYRERYIPIGWKENKVYPRIRALLNALKERGVYLAVATGKPEHTSIDILRYFDLLQYFDAVAGPTPGDLHADKGELIRRVLPGGKRAVMVGDIAGDIKGAQNAGIDSIAALYGYGEKNETLAASPTHAVETTQALCDLLCPGMESPKGFFVTLEGVDGCGKSTQAAALKERLEQFGYTVRRTREPGGCPIAEDIRKIVLAKEDGGMCAETEALLFAAARAQHLKDTILPAIHCGKVVLCDRFVDSSLVYQGMARGLGLDWVKEINRPAFRESAPGATLWLKMSHEKALARRMAVSQPDRIEQAGDSFHAQTEEGFAELARQYPERFLAVNADQEPEQVTEEAFSLLFQRMKERGVL
ncbi:MAG: dTMP kinase [Clostridia bacterium]|nr:dTMP kinase [Clostridia bacterium]